VLTATPGDAVEGVFRLDDEDRDNAELKKRLDAKKPALLIAPAKAKA
jgi:hypothetical protein